MASSAKVTRREIDLRFRALEKSLNRRFDNLIRSADLERESQRLRNENMNEWRLQSRDQTATYATRNDMESLSTRLSDLKAMNDRREGRSMAYTGILTLVPTLLALFALLR